MTGATDAGSTAGKPLAIRAHAQLLVVGAGPAGCAAATEAARRGLAVVLVDEHPVDAASIGLDVPFHFGGRAGGAVRNRGAMIERLIEATPAIADAFEAGVDVQLGVACWGLFVPRPGIAWIGRQVAGLTDGETSWFCGFDAAILATGRRDAGVAFPGWELPGVMGVTAAEHLLRRYEALDARTLVILGSGPEATAFAEAARAAGRTVAAIVEAAPRPVDAEGCARLAASGVSILAGAMIGRASGRAEVERVAVVSLDGTPVVEIACDTVVLATGVVPVIELFDVAGAETTFAADRGGHVPVVGPDGETSLPTLFGAGDCTGIAAERSRDPAVAAADGIRAAAAAARAIEQGAAMSRPAPADDRPASLDAATGREVWARATMAVADADTLICQCEEVGVADLLGLRPPRYLGCAEPALAARDLLAFAAEGRLNQDQVKRLTRAGMGPCQGRRCREQVGAVLAVATATPSAAIPLPSYRAPVRPLPLSAFGDADEPAEMTDHWEGWFGIASQWRPYWETSPDDVAGEDVR